MKNVPLMPRATAVWLVENTSISFKQIADFCNLHELEINGIADGEVAKGIKAYNPILAGQLTREEIELCSKDHNRSLQLSQKIIDVDPLNGLIFGELTINGMEQPEGLCFLNNHDILIVGEPNFYTTYSNMNLFNDLNYDGHIDHYDLEIIIDYLYFYSILSEFQILNVDLDRNQIIDIFDILLFVEFFDN